MDTTSHPNPAAPPDDGLSWPARALLRELPAPAPNALARHFPRILNNLAAYWRDPREADRYLDSLVFDARGGRQGFPVEVLGEIARLRRLNEARLPRARDPWSETDLR